MDSLRRLAANPRYREGVIAQMFYVAAQIMCWTFIIQYADRLGIDKSTAQKYNIAAMSMFLCSRFISTFLMKYVNGSRLLMIFAICAMCTTAGTILIDGMGGLYCLVATSAFMSLMFPTIYGIALEGVDKDKTLGAAFLVMAIVGGALMPPMQGAIIDLGTVAGMASVNFSFILPFICFCRAFLIAFLVFSVLAGVFTAHLARYAISVCPRILVMSTMLPFFFSSRPKGDVAVFIPGRVVGDICPPVIPNTLLLITMARIFSFRMALYSVDSMPML